MLISDTSETFIEENPNHWSFISENLRTYELLFDNVQIVVWEHLNTVQG